MSIDLKKKQYVDFKVYSVTKIKDKYGFRIKLIYDDGTSEIQQKSGYIKKKDAESERNGIIAQLYNKTYVVNTNIKVSDFFEYWLEDVLKKEQKITYGTYLAYRNVIQNYIKPYLGHLNIVNLNISHIQKFYKKTLEKSESVVRLAKTVMNTGLAYALKRNVISKNIALEVNLPKDVKKKQYRIRNIDSSQTLNVEQAKVLIDASKNTPIHLQIMFALLMGMRLSEINGLKYSDIDFVNRKLHIQRQLGVDIKKNKSDCRAKTLTKQEVRLKTKSSDRILDIPDILFETIQEERKKYEKNKNRRKNDVNNPFRDENYICCSSYGNSRSRGFHQKYYKQLLKENNLPDIRFHDLRHSFGTILLKANFDVKAVSQMLGHASEIITVDVYCDKEEIIYDCLDILEPYINSIIPKEEQNNDYSEDEDIEQAMNKIVEFIL